MRRSNARPANRTRSSSDRPAFAVVALGAVVAIAAILLVLAVVTGPLADGLHPVATVDGAPITRSDLRGRMAIDARIVDAQRRWMRSLVAAGRVAPEDIERLSATIDAQNADPIRAAIDGLVDDAVIRKAATTRGVAMVPDAGQALHEAAVGPASVRIRTIAIGDPPASGGVTGVSDWPGPPPRSLSPTAVEAVRREVGTRVRGALDQGQDIGALRAALEAAGWRAVVSDSWLASKGPAPGLPDGLVAEARAATAPGPLGVTVDPVSGLVATGAVVDIALPRDAVIDDEGLEGSALAAWTAARTAERALRDAMLTTWTTQPVELVQVAELVIGPADIEGVTSTFVSFSHLVLRALPPDELAGQSPQDRGSSLLADLRALAPDARLHRFDELVGEAAALTGDPLERSGPTSFLTKDQVLSDLAGPAFAPSVQIGDVFGPIETSAGPELFQVRGTFTGTLDDRSNAALVEARGAADLLALARQISPEGTWPRAAGVWRAEDEFAGEAELRAAADHVGARGAVQFDNEILLIEPLGRRTALPPPDAAARLAIRGFASWLEGARGYAVVVRDPEPLPGITVEQPSTTVSSSSPGLDAIPAPNLPNIVPSP